MKKIVPFLIIAAMSVSVAQARGSGGGSHSHSSGSHSSSSYSSTYGSSHSGSPGSHSVRGYTRSDGTYVQPHHSTNRDGDRNNNWSTKGNVNPYTGKPGTVEPYPATRP